MSRIALLALRDECFCTKLGHLEVLLYGYVEKENRGYHSMAVLILLLPPPARLMMPCSFQWLMPLPLRGDRDGCRVGSSRALPGLFANEEVPEERSVPARRASHSRSNLTSRTISELDEKDKRCQRATDAERSDPRSRSPPGRGQLVLEDRKRGLPRQIEVAHRKDSQNIPGSWYGDSAGQQHHRGMCLPVVVSGLLGYGPCSVVNHSAYCCP